MVFIERRDAILQACKQHQLPSEMMIPKVLTSDLHKLDRELETSNQGLAIPVDDVTRYYQLPISDCAISNDEIIVHLRVPITQRGERWELYELITFPFAWHNQTCIIPQTNMYMATATIKNQQRIISGSGLHQCKPFHDKLSYQDFQQVKWTGLSSETLFGGNSR